MEQPTIHYHFPLRQRVQWGEMDAFAHVNNVSYIRFFETARIHFMAEAGLWKAIEEEGLMVILAKIECNYRQPLYYPDEMTLQCGIKHIGNTSIVVHHQVLNGKGELAAEGEGVTVLLDAKSGKKATITPSLKAKLEQYL